MKTLLGLLLFATGAIRSLAHPSSGLVVSDQGDVYFVYSSKGLARVEGAGRFSIIHQSKGGHWLCLDRKGSFSTTQPKFFERVTPDGVIPAIIFADGGAPIAAGKDGRLYFGSNWESGDVHAPGGLTVSCLNAAGSLTHLSSKLKATLEASREGVTGLAAGPDGFLYVASPSRIHRVDVNGEISLVASPGAPKGCDEDLPPNWKPPGFRALDVTNNGLVFAAATGCRQVLKVERNGDVAPILTSERPWNPTAVAAHQDSIYVLEWTNANGGVRDGWRPRVRKLHPDKSISVLLEIQENISPP